MLIRRRKVVSGKGGNHLTTIFEISHLLISRHLIEVSRAFRSGNIFVTWKREVKLLIEMGIRIRNFAKKTYIDTATYNVTFWGVGEAVWTFKLYGWYWGFTNFTSFISLVWGLSINGWLFIDLFTITKVSIKLLKYRILYVNIHI